jgi:hypothetical protein
MSFTSTVKNEITKLELEEIEKITFLSAIIQNQDFDYDRIKISTENASLARKVFTILKDLYQATPIITVRKGYNYNKNYIYIIEITKRVKEILNNLGIEFNNKIRLYPMPYIIDDIELKRVYLSGIFSICGSINDPKKSRYHLEMSVNNLEYASFISDIINGFHLNSKVIKKDNKYMIYIKEAEKIADFLRVISATNALLYYEDIRIYRDHKNMTNRLNNCEQANVDKTIFASTQLLEDVQILKDNDLIDLLDEKEKIVLEYREKYPDSSLQELSEIISLETGHKITKSGLHHRFNKIKLLAQKCKEKQNNV